MEQMLMILPARFSIMSGSTALEQLKANISVEFRLNDNMGYAPETKLRLSTAKLQELGWSPQNDLKAILSKLISTYK